MYQFFLESLSFWDFDPLHVTIEAICIVIIVYLWFQKSYKIRERPETLTEQVPFFFYHHLFVNNLSQKEIDTLVDEWEPEPLVPRLSEQQKWGDEKWRILKRYLNAPLLILMSLCFMVQRTICRN